MEINWMASGPKIWAFPQFLSPKKSRWHLEWWPGSWPRSFVGAFNAIMRRGKIPKQGISSLNFQFFIRNLMVVCGLQMSWKHFRAEVVESPAWSRTDRTKLSTFMEKLHQDLHRNSLPFKKSQKFQPKNRSSSCSKCNTVRNHPLYSLDRLRLTQTQAATHTQTKQNTTQKFGLVAL